MNPNSVARTPNVQAQPVQPEPNPMAMGPTKPGKGGAIAAVLFAILAVAGIGFGVWAMLDSKAQKDALNEQITTLKEQNNELRDKIAELEESCGSGSTKCGNEDMSGYVYLEELGIKLKRPENWQDMVKKYDYSNESPQGVDAYEFRESLDPGDGVSISVVNTSCDEEIATRRVCFAVDDMNIIVAQLVGELTAGDDIPVSETFWNYFSNPENYSAI